jgi:hypothetical protein
LQLSYNWLHCLHTLSLPLLFVLLSEQPFYSAQDHQCTDRIKSELLFHLTGCTNLEKEVYCLIHRKVWTGGTSGIIYLLWPDSNYHSISLSIISP